MNVWKVINNNIVLSRNDDNQEVVIMGKGLGFKKKQVMLLMNRRLRICISVQKSGASIN